MSRAPRSELRVKGLGLRARFAFSMSIALAVVMLLAGALLYVSVSRLSDNRVHQSFSGAARFSRDTPAYERVPGGFLNDGVRIQEIVYGDDLHGTIYSYGDEQLGYETIFVPQADDGRRATLGLLIGVITLVVLVGACVALLVASQVTRPIQSLIDDVRQIAKGNLNKKVKARGAGEIELLGRSIDRMTADLREAQEAELELSIRKREREVAGGVREALMPLTTPEIPGYDTGGSFLPGPDFGGDFHQFIERADGRLGLLVCGVSGNGIPAGLVGATARSYLRGELEQTDDLVGSLQRVNRWVFGDVRRGMYVTALYALLDPEAGRAQIVCAGHRVPLLRYDAAEDQVRVVHPEGIALGFDKGPVFDRRIQMVETPIEPGDRFLLTNSGPVELTSPDGKELGEKPFYSRFLKHAALETTPFLKSLRRDLESFTGGQGLDRDVSLLTIRRDP